VDRIEWLKTRRQLTQERFDTLFAATYDAEWGAISPTHRRVFARFLELSPPSAYILDAACGTGKYWPLILDSGRSVFGIDQSRQMLLRAQAKFPAIQVDHVGLQEMAYREAFDGACCMDAMECIFPKDWPLVLGNLHRAIQASGPLYFTVEIAAEAELVQAYNKGLTLGIPVVYGEWAHEGGYHYYPEIQQVRSWLEHTGFDVIYEDIGDEYHHFLVQKAPHRNKMTRTAMPEG
jgi:SAM-dependent methyltransferase